MPLTEEEKKIERKSTTKNTEVQKKEKKKHLNQ